MQASAGRGSRSSTATSLAMSRNTSAPVVIPLVLDAEVDEEGDCAASHTSSSFRAALAHSQSVDEGPVPDTDEFDLHDSAPLFDKFSPRQLSRAPRHHNSRLGSAADVPVPPSNADPSLSAEPFTPEQSSTPRARPLSLAMMASDTALGASLPDHSDMRPRSRCIERSSAASSSTSLNSSLNGSLNRSQPGSATWCDSPGRAKFVLGFAMDDDEPRRTRGRTLPTHTSDEHAHMLPADLRRQRAGSTNAELKALLRRSKDDSAVARTEASTLE